MIGGLVKLKAIDGTSCYRITNSVQVSPAGHHRIKSCLSYFEVQEKQYRWNTNTKLIIPMELL